MKKIAIVTLGCDKNTNDMENLAGVLKKKGYELETDASKADAVVVRTCSFIEAPKKESVEAILKAAQVKNDKAKLIVTGCMVQQHGKDMMDELPEVDAFLGTGQISQVPEFLEKPRDRYLDRRDPSGYMDPDATRVLSTNGKTTHLRLSEGCSHPCSFCVIPKVRGGLQSRPEEVLLKEARELANQGIQEILLIGQDTGEWGKDLYGEPRLAPLLKKLRDMAAFKWIRLLYMHPASLTADIIQVLSESPDLFPYLDMPLQHIDDDILHDMNRHHTEQDARDIITTLKATCPGITLRTTFIVGYPGETEAQFSHLNRFVEEGHFEALGAFPYSKEESTPAGIKANQISDSIKEERHARLMETQMNAAAAKAQKRLGKTEEVLIDLKEGDFLYGRTRHEAPEIDAVVRLPKTAGEPGQLVNAKLKSWDAYEFEGEL